jgi:hypothetical protein
MKFIKKHIFFIFLLAGIFATETMFSQIQGETKEHKKMWRRFGRKRHPDAFNPYVKNGKATHESSRKQKREDARLIRKAKREYKKGIRRSARKRTGK